MYVDLCKYKRGNKTYKSKRVLLREGYREGGKVKMPFWPVGRQVGPVADYGPLQGGHNHEHGCFIKQRF